MNLDDLIQEKISKSRLYGVTKPSIIKEMLKIPEEVNIKKLDKFIDSYYDTFYLKKKNNQRKLTHEEKINKFLNIEKSIEERFVDIPTGENYRKIITINDKDKWLKKSQKIFNKILVNIILDEKVRGQKQKSIIPYLHSAVKQRSYYTNAKAHIGDKYVLAIDLKDFYPSVTRYKLFLFFKKHFNISSDIAMFYSLL